MLHDVEFKLNNEFVNSGNDLGIKNKYIFGKKVPILEKVQKSF